MDEIDVRRFRKILRIFERELDVQNQSGCCCGVTIAQCHALMALDEKDKISLNELADKIHLDKSTVSRTIENLVLSGLVHREIPKSNRRTVILKLTNNGRDICKTINSGNDSYYLKAFNQIQPELWEPFLQAFEALTKAMSSSNKCSN